MILTILGISVVIILVIILATSERDDDIHLEDSNCYKDCLEIILRWTNRQEKAIAFPLDLPEDIKQLFIDNGFKVDIEEVKGTNYIVARK